MPTKKGREIPTFRMESLRNVGKCLRFVGKKVGTPYVPRQNLPKVPTKVPTEMPTKVPTFAQSLINPTENAYVFAYVPPTEKVGKLIRNAGGIHAAYVPACVPVAMMPPCHAGAERRLGAQHAAHVGGSERGMVATPLPF